MLNKKTIISRIIFLSILFLAFLVSGVSDNKSKQLNKIEYKNDNILEATATSLVRPLPFGNVVTQEYQLVDYPMEKYSLGRYSLGSYPMEIGYIDEDIIESFMIEEGSFDYYAEIFLEDQKKVETEKTIEDQIKVAGEESIEDQIKVVAEESIEDQIEAAAEKPIEEQLETTAEKFIEDQMEIASEESKKEDLPGNTLEKSIFLNIGISIADSYLNIREEANTTSKILGKLFRGSAATILEKNDQWYYIESGTVKGYVNSEYIKANIPDDELIEKYAKQRASILADGLNLRSEANEESKILAVVYQKEIYPVIKTMDTWVNIEIPNSDRSGYVKKDYVEIITEFTYALSTKEEELQLKKEEDKKKAKETELVKRQATDSTVDDFMLLTCLVHSEAGGESYEGKLAVANVVLNRVKSSKYPSTLEKVIYQKGQFSVAASGILAKQLAKYDDYTSSSHKSSIKAAKAALDGDNNIGNRLYFNLYKPAVRQGYDKRDNSVKIGSQLFW